MEKIERNPYEPPATAPITRPYTISAVAFALLLCLLGTLLFGIAGMAAGNVVAVYFFDLNAGQSVNIILSRASDTGGCFGLGLGVVASIVAMYFIFRRRPVSA